AEFITRLSTSLGDLTGTHHPDRWTEILIGIADNLVATAFDEEWQRAQAIRSITAAFDDPSDDLRPTTTPLRLGDVRDL
ncbi:exodeoxyribonuclease V subunit gamma, partial [Streptomyces sp. SID10244]|nr:exodeoxyribonuclease V subunit gamma [Streptomyces sp. SID10244]